jgi:hypothetical protein
MYERLAGWIYANQLNVKRTHSLADIVDFVFVPIRNFEESVDEGNDWTFEHVREVIEELALRVSQK